MLSYVSNALLLQDVQLEDPEMDSYYGHRMFISNH